MEFEDARADLDAWRAAFPADPYAADLPLRQLNRRALPDARREALDSAAGDFGRAVVAEIGPAARRYEHRSHLPELVAYDAFGRLVEDVQFDPEYHRAGRVVWGSGLVAASGEPGRAHEQATLLYLLSLEGEAGHACPATCTIGLARALRRRADAEVRDRFLPPLLETTYDRAERGSQFLTEVQGGSDVGANATRATPNADGSYQIRGEKWFCSVADADQFLMTARLPDAPPGTRGLGCFVVPRRVDGRPNGFRVRRLKEKLGTRGVASGELDFDGAIAWPIGPVEEGFKTAVGVVLNTSRWMTALGSTGMMRRAYLEASAYARVRRAFDRQIAGFPAVRRTLARMKAEWLGALHVVALLTELEDAIDACRADESAVAQHRFLVNAVKLHTSIEATMVVRDGIEVLGGNGTIEEFSVLPRLYRDAMVYESWEGTHNVLCAQVVNDCRRLELLPALVTDLADRLAAGPSEAATAAELATAALHRARAGLARALTDPEHASFHSRTDIAAVVVVAEIATLLDAARGTDPELAAELAAAADLLARTRLEPAARPADDAAFARRVDAVLGEDATT